MNSKSRYHVPGGTFHVSEKRLLGMSHSEVGPNPARQWSFPEALAMAVQYHHQPDKCPGYGALCAIVYLADLLMPRFHAGMEIERLQTQDLTRHLAVLGLTCNDFTDLVDIIPPSIFKPAA